VFVALLAIAVVIPQTIALTNQGLFYRMEDGDRFYYTMDVIDEGETAPTYVIYLEIDNSSKPIPDPLTSLADLDYLDVSAYFENGTSMGLLILIFLFIPQLEYPVGNWSLIDSLAQTDLQTILLAGTYDITISDSTDTWGYSYKTNDTDSETTIWIDYSKFDGMMSLYRVEYFNTTTSQMISEWEIRRFTYHNLEWGFTDGARFNYHLSMTGDDLGYQDLEEDFYLKVDPDGLYTLPYLVDEWSDIPFLGADIYWANDTISYDAFLSNAQRLAVPIGNWSLLDTLIDDLTFNITIDDMGPWFWGFTWNDTCGDMFYEVHSDYLKSDGFLAGYSVVATNTTTSETIGTITVTRDGLEPLYDTTAPVLNHPNDMEFVEGTENHNITWTPTDDYPDDFEISVNGVVVDMGSWASLSAIVLDLDSFDDGVYTCSITVYDVAGNSATDTVMVNVTAIPTTGGLTDLLMDNILYIALGVGAIVVIGAVVCMRRKS
jgi:hypothetical protein